MRRYSKQYNEMYENEKGIWLTRYDVSMALQKIKDSVYEILESDEHVVTEVERVIRDIEILKDKLD